MARILVMGAGGVGGYFGAALQHGGHEVVLVARGENLRALQRGGLLVTGARGETRIEVSATDVPSSAGPCDLVLMTVKSYDLEEACEAVRDNGGIVLTLQNGVDAAERVRAILGDVALAGTTGIVADLSGPGHVHLVSDYARIRFGEPDGGRSERVDLVHGWLRAGGRIESLPSEDVRVALWEKMALICGMAGLTTLCRAPIGEVLADPDGAATFERLLGECEAVARARGVPLPGGFVAERLGYARGVDPAATSSMLRDFLRDRRLELEHLNGAVVRLGAEVGVSVPVHEAVSAGIRVAAARRGSHVV